MSLFLPDLAVTSLTLAPLLPLPYWHFTASIHSELRSGLHAPHFPLDFITLTSNLLFIISSFSGFFLFFFQKISAILDLVSYTSITAAARGAIIIHRDPV